MTALFLVAALAGQIPTAQAPSGPPYAAPPLTLAVVPPAPSAAPAAVQSPYVNPFVVAPSPAPAPTAQSPPMAPQQGIATAAVGTALVGVIEQPWIWDRLFGLIGSALEKRGHPRIRIVPPAAQPTGQAVQLVTAPPAVTAPVAAASPQYLAPAPTAAAGQVILVQPARPSVMRRLFPRD